MAKKWTNEEVIKQIHENYKGINKKMVAELNLASSHGGLTGNFREEMWMKFFRDIVPKKFSLAQGVIIIDSNGNMSNEVDIAIFDEQYTPYVLQYGSLKFIPIEAVACVVECKSLNPKITDLRKWSNSIDKLESNPTGIARVIQGLAIGLTNKTQQRTRPIKIQVSLKNTQNDAFEKCLDKYFDIIIRPKIENIDGDKIELFSSIIFNEYKTLSWWVKKLNGSMISENEIYIEHLKEKQLENYEFKTEIKRENRSIKYMNKATKEKMEFESEYAEEKIYLKNTLADLRIEGNEILSLTFQLNQLLMLINNPMMFPHFAYAKTFNNIINPTQENEKKS